MVYLLVGTNGRAFGEGLAGFHLLAMNHGHCFLKKNQKTTGDGGAARNFCQKSLTAPESAIRPVNDSVGAS
jgi:hypothetical protein